MATLVASSPNRKTQVRGDSRMNIKTENKGLLGLLSNLRTKEITQWGSDSGTVQERPEERRDAEVFNGANVVTSERIDDDWLTFEREHAVLLDLDVPAYLIPSSSAGHSHLYIDVRAKEKDYFALLDALAKCGVIEKGYAAASKKKGATYLRLPWVKKHHGPAAAVTSKVSF